MSLMGLPNDVLDTLTVISLAANFLFMTENAMLWKIKDTIGVLMKATTRLGPNNWLVALRWTVDNRLKMQNILLDENDHFKMWLKKGKESREIKKGTVRPGLDHLEYMLVTDDCTSTIDLDDWTRSKVGSTPAYVAAQNDLAYSDGFQDGFKRSNSWGILDSLQQNWQAVVVVGMILIVSGLVFYEKIFTSPSCQSNLQSEIAEKNMIIGKCSPYLDLSNVEAEVSSVPPPNPDDLSRTGSQIKTGG